MSEKEYSLCADCFDLEFLKPKEKPKEKPEEKPEEQKPSEPEGRLIDLEEDWKWTVYKGYFDYKPNLVLKKNPLLLRPSSVY